MGKIYPKAKKGFALSEAFGHHPRIGFLLPSRRGHLRSAPTATPPIYHLRAEQKVFSFEVCQVFYTCVTCGVPCLRARDSTL